MAGQVDAKQLQLQISASAELLVRNLQRADNALASYGRQTDSRLGSIDDRFARLGAGAAQLRESMGGFVAALGVGSVASAAGTYLQLADTSKQLHAQLVLATAQYGSLAQAQADAERIAATTRIGLEATTSLYGTFLRAAIPLGRTQADAATASETFAKALKLGGASAETASQATLQFSQALASGALRGDEFNSIAEASPRILRLLAEAMGIPQGQLRALAAEGKLTADVLYNALTNTKVTAGLDAEFKQLPVTMGEAMTLVRDEAVKVAGAFERGSHLATSISTLVTDGVEGFGSLADAAEQSGLEIRASFTGLRDVFAPMLEGANNIFSLIDSRANYTRDTIASILGAYDRVRNVGVAIDRGVHYLDSFNPLRDKKPAPAYFDTRGQFLRSYQGTVTQAARARREEARRGSTAAPRREIAPAGARAKAKGRVARPRSGTPEKPFELKSSDFPDLYDSAKQAAAIERGAAEMRDRFVAVFSEADPLGQIVESFNREQAERQPIFGEREIGELERYRDQLRAATGDMSVALQGVAVNGFAALENELLGVIDGTQSLSGAFKNMTRSIIADLARIAIQKAIVSAIGGSFLGLKLKNGGPVPRFAGGGRVYGPGGPREDRVPAMLSAGEFVVNASAYARHAPLIEAINGGRLPRFADGGAVSLPPLQAARLPSLASLRGGGGASEPIKIVLQVTEGEAFEAKVLSVSGPQAVQVVREAAPQLTRLATDNTIAELRKPRI